jgi:hypothetical protein
MTLANVIEIGKFSEVLNILNLLLGPPVLADQGYISDQNRDILKNK